MFTLTPALSPRRGGKDGSRGGYRNATGWWTICEFYGLTELPFLASAAFKLF